MYNNLEYRISFMNDDLPNLYVLVSFQRTEERTSRNNKNANRQVIMKGEVLTYWGQTHISKSVLKWAAILSTGEVWFAR